MGKECDSCKISEYTDDNPRVFMCMPRPSDMSEMCCVMAGHRNCIAAHSTLPDIGQSGGVATAEQWEEWIDNDTSLRMGFIFLTL